MPNLIETARRGATRARREELDPINLVKRIMDQYPQADVDEICRRVKTALGGRDKAYQPSFNDYCTRNHFNLLRRDEQLRLHAATRRQPRVTVTEEQRAVETRAAEHRANETINAIRQIVLMELPTPFDKPLGDLTESEGKQLTGWHAKLFEGIGNRKLREARSENDLQAAWRNALLSGL